MKWATRRSCRTQVVPVSVHHGGRPHHRTQAQGSPPAQAAWDDLRVGDGSPSHRFPRLPPIPQDEVEPLEASARPDGTNQRGACPRFPSNSAAGPQTGQDEAVAWNCAADDGKLVGFFVSVSP